MSARIVSGIYRIRNTVNGKVYVGSAVDLADRWRCHRKDLNKGNHHCEPLQRAWVKYGALAFVFEIIEAVERNKEALESREQVHLDAAFATGLCYNTCRTAGSSLGVKHSEEARARNIAAQRRIAHSPGYVNQFLGRKHSAESRAKNSAARLKTTRTAGYKHHLLGYVPTKETLAKLAAAQKGRKHTAETRRKISDGLTGRPVSEATRAKIAAPQIGKKMSAESRAKMSASGIKRARAPGYKHPLLGYKHSEEARAKMSAAKKALVPRPRRTPTHPPPLGAGEEIR